MNSSTEGNRHSSEMQQNLELLQELSCFAGFPLQALKLLALLAQRGQLEDGETVFERGDDPGQAHLLLTGELSLRVHDEQVEEEIHRYFAGDFIGRLSLLGPLPALFELRAVSDCTTLTVTREHFAKIVEQFPQTGKLFVKAALDELYQWERKNITEAKSCCLVRLGATVL